MSVILSSKAQLEHALNPYYKQGARIGFVPTMGALHAGHCSLMHAAKAANDVVVLSIFVNPRQFNDSSDFDKYPRTLTADIECAENEGVDFIYLPSYDELFAGHSVASEVALNGLDASMEGASRPGHFRGVVEVVYALFDHVKPSNAYFGQKDFQQLAIIRHMTKEYGFPIEIVACDTLREPSGLAMSSRNMRLSDEQKIEALIIWETLKFVQSNKLTWRPNELKTRAVDFFEKGTLKLEYLEIVNSENLLEAEDWVEPTVCCIAAFSGEVRLIDNLLL